MADVRTVRDCQLVKQLVQGRWARWGGRLCLRSVVNLLQGICCGGAARSRHCTRCNEMHRVRVTLGTLERRMESLRLLGAVRVSHVGNGFVAVAVQEGCWAQRTIGPHYFAGWVVQG